MASNIKVLLTLDNKQFVGSLNQADKEAKQFSSNAKRNVDEAAASFNKLNGVTNNLSAGFSRLKTVLLGAAFVGFARSAIQMADAIKDLSSVTGQSIGQILALQEATKAAGGNAELAGKGLLYFYEQVNSAAEGNAKLQLSFSELGISLSDLAKLTERELFIKSIERLAKMEEGAKKTALQADLLSSKFKNVTIDDEFVRKLKDGDEATLKMAESVEKAARLNDQWEESITKIKLAFLEAFNPIIKGVADLLEKMPSLITAFKVLGVIIAGVFVASGLRTFISLLGMAGRGVAAIASGFSKLRSMGGVGKALGAGASNKGLMSMRDAASAVGLGAGAVGGAALLFGEDDEAEKKASEARRTSTGVIGGQKKEKEAVREVVDAFARKRAEIAKASADYQKVNDRVIEQISLEDSLIGKNREQSELEKARVELTRRTKDEVDRLTAAKAQMTDEEKKAGLGKNYDEQIAKVQELGKAEEERLSKSIELSFKLQEVEKNRLFALQREYDYQDQLKRIQDDTANLTLTTLERKYKDLERAARDAADAEIRAREEEGKRPLSDAEKEKIRALSRERLKDLEKETEANHNTSRSFATGWKQAFIEYVENATNAAEQARQVFQRATKGMEDLIINFAKTGKFEFKSFINDIVEMLLRSEIQRTMASIFSSNTNGGGATNFFSGIGKMLGFANGTTSIPTNGPVLVGERGPEILTGAAGRGVIPNHQLGGTTQVTYNINAVDARSFQQLVASDPEFIYAVTLKGQRSMPGGR